MPGKKPRTFNRLHFVLFEWKKNANRLFWLILLGLIVADVIKISSEFTLDATTKQAQNMKADKEYQAFVSEISGEITKERIDRIIAGRQRHIQQMELQVVTDQEGRNCSRIYDYYRYCYEYDRQSYALAQKAKENVVFYQDHGDDRKAQENRLAYSVYSGRKNILFSPQNGYDWLFRYDFSTLLILILATYLSFGFFFREKNEDTYQILLTSGSRKMIFFGKLLVLGCLLLIGCLALSLTDHLVVGRSMNLSWPTAKLYSEQAYQYCVPDLSILAYDAVLFAFRYLHAFLMMLTAAFLSNLFEGRILPVLSSLSVPLLSVFVLEYYFKPDSWFRTFQIRWIGNRLLLEYQWILILDFLLLLLLPLACFLTFAPVSPVRTAFRLLKRVGNVFSGRRKGGSAYDKG
ncbi:MAG: ABC transporter permease subunit [Lachnospiraceae bacterium]|nr:ABC transporter permease subunit [Lachnospiraceae bacterium]